MAEYSFANLDAWTSKAERRSTAVAQQATSDMLSEIEIVPGITRGGRPQRGTIPRDIGTLAGSLQSTLYGSTSLSGEGETSWIGVVGAMQGGDVAQFSWGGDNAPYALPIHYGSGSYPGTFWRDEAAAKWGDYVAAAITRAKVLFP
jgi:hypothetical protein